MKIGIDIDDTITDTMQYMTRFVSQYFNLDEKFLIDNNIYYINLPENIKDKEKEFCYKIMGRELLNIPIKPNAKNVITKLKSDGNQIIIVTARDYQTYKQPIEETKKQLNKLGINYDKLICTRDKKKACNDENIDIFIDDSMRNLAEVKEVVKKVYLFTSPYNKNYEVEYERVCSWEVLYNLINNYKNEYEKG